jgi:chromosome segregation ATPase
MADETTITTEETTPDAAEKNGQNDQPGAAEQPQEQEREKFIPRERFDQVNTRMKDAEQKVSDMQAQLDKLTKDRAAADEKRLEDEAKWQELAEKRKGEVDALKPYEERVKVLEDTVAGVVASIIAEYVDPDMADLIPDFEDPVQRLEYIKKNLERLRRPKTAPSLDGGARSDKGKRTSGLKPKIRM